MSKSSAGSFNPQVPRLFCALPPYVLFHKGLEPSNFKSPSNSRNLPEQQKPSYRNPETLNLELLLRSSVKGSLMPTVASCEGMGLERLFTGFMRLQELGGKLELGLGFLVAVCGDFCRIRTTFSILAASGLWVLDCHT